MNVIIDYDVGNLDSVLRGFERAGIKSMISKDPLIIEKAASLVLPGVGAFNEAMLSLKKTGLIPYIKAHIESNKPLFGICLGMQLLFDSSDEFVLTEGLGFLKGSIKRLPIKEKIPHMGWNQLVFNQENHPVLKLIKPLDDVYFVHSYYVECEDDLVVAYADYGVNVPAIVTKDNIIATQFHPEKSADVGEAILKAYKEMIK